MHRRSFVAVAGITMAGSAARLAPPVAGAAVEETPEYDASETVRGESDVRLEVETEEDDEHVEYLEDEDEVRYVMGWQSTDPGREAGDEPPEREPVYSTVEWERWGRLRTRSAAASAAADHVVDELDLAEHDVGGGVSSRVPGDDSAAIVSVFGWRDSVDVGVDELAAATPSTVQVTYVLEDREFEHEEPVFARLERRRPEPDAGGTSVPGTGPGALAALGGLGAAAAALLSMRRGRPDEDAQSRR